MKNHLLLALLATAALQAQPVVNPNNLIMDLNTEAFFAEVENLDPGPAGANRNWNLTNLDLIPVGTSTTTSPVGTAFENSFPTANYCSATTGEFQGGYTYFRYDNQSMELLGDAFTGIGIFSFDPNPRTYITFPYTYNTVINDTYHADNIAFTATYDGYGSLTVPFGTYHNVIRQKIEELGTTNYVWFNANPFFPIAQTTEGGIGLMRATNLSAQQFTPSQTISVWPNPSRDVFWLEGVPSQSDILVCDLKGQVVLQAQTQTTSASVDLSGFASGVYVLKIDALGQQTIKKIVKY
ncbi:T9SS type A sorting domain-containing protein [Flavobacterium caeni]|uniref:Por secretion system C-terminal sorting domain-containing protein n=1 Tax=Flavobacterium caeni TaxID=490189 RepID=A0A1G5BNU2_9FLAO|nr:T9SS type A sorting domain-containing protein [Flavobacterium caeni]SCX91756.1 Por secretion system C-terminal sorting domain-containing protein [Flavobacterium caeni]